MNPPTARAAVEAIAKAGLLLVCLLVAMVSSWPWLVEPNLRPGMPAPFDEVAPKDALVPDSEALEQRRSSLVPHTFVQVIDQQESQRLRERLERQLSELERVARSDEADRVGPVNLTLWNSSGSPTRRRKPQNSGIKQCARRRNAC